MNAGKYVAIIGDIRDSRKIEDRNVVQSKLRAVLNQINADYADDIFAEFVIVMGDSFQGLVRGGHVLEIVYKIRMAIVPEKIRVGIGIGEITTDTIPANSLEVDGPAYYIARRAIEYLEANENKNRNVPADIYIDSDADDADKSLLINTVLEMMTALEMSWTPRQKEVMFDMLMHRDGQMKTAERMKTAQPNISRFLMSGNYYTYEKAYINLERIISELCL